MDSSLVNIGIMLFLVVVLAIGLVALLLFHAWARQSAPERVLVDGFKVANPRLGREEMRGRMQGHFVELGFDARIHQSAILAESERMMNVLNLGPTGAGKTSYFLSTFLWRDIAARDMSIVVFDATRGLTPSILALAEQYGRKVRIYPDAGFNPLGGPGSARERAAAFADLLAQTPEVSGGASDYYSQVEQRFVRAILPLFERVYARPMILRELLELAISPERRRRLIEAAGVSPEAAEFHLQFDNWSAEDWRRGLSGLITFIDRLTIGSRNFLYNQREAISLEEALERKELIVIREGGERQSQDRTLGLLFMVALQRFAARRDPLASTHLISVYLDEAHMYFNPTFPTFIATSRQKRFALQLGFQNFAQFEPFTKTVISNARTWLVHGGLEVEDARLISDNIGQRQHIDRSVRTAPPGSAQAADPSRQESLVYDYLLHPHEIQGLPGDTLLALSVAGREMAAMRLLKKPPPLTIRVQRFQEPLVPDYAPPTLWWNESNERNEQNESKVDSARTSTRTRTTTSASGHEEKASKQKDSQKVSHAGAQVSLPGEKRHAKRGAQRIAQDGIQSSDALNAGTNTPTKKSRRATRGASPDW